MQDRHGSRRGAVSPDSEPGAPPLSHSGLVYLTCPVCERRIEEPFNPEGGPQVFVHRRSRSRNCRLVIVPAERLVRAVPVDVPLERALAREITRRAS